MREGRTVILDNGVYEGEEVHPSDLAALGAWLRPTFLVLPDAPNIFKENQERAHHFLSNYGWLWPEDGPDGLTGYTRPMKILHGTEWWHFRKGADTAFWKGVCALGFSRLTRTFGLETDTRVEAMRRLRKWSGEYFNLVYLHAFGWVSLEDLAQAAAEGFRSIDTSAPINRGLHRVLMGDPWPDYPFNLDMTVQDERRIATAQANLGTLDLVLK